VFALNREQHLKGESLLNELSADELASVVGQ
jgi:hypothetical protein